MNFKERNPEAIYTPIIQVAGVPVSLKDGGSRTEHQPD